MESPARKIRVLPVLMLAKNLTGLWSRWQEDCPLTYTSPNAPTTAYVLGTRVMAVIGRRTEHGEQTPLTLTGLHAEFDEARAALMRVSALLQTWVAHAAEQSNATTVWRLCCGYLERMLADVGRSQPPQRLPPPAIEPANCGI